MDRFVLSDTMVQIGIMLALALASRKREKSMCEVKAKVDYADCMSLAERVVKYLDDEKVREVMLIELLANHYNDHPEYYQNDIQELGKLPS